MAAADTIVARSRSIFVCNGTAKVSAGADLADIKVASPAGAVTVSFEDGEPVDTAHRKLVIVASMESELTGKPAAAFRALWEYWDRVQNPGIDADAPPRPEGLPALDDFLRRLGAAKNDAAHEVASLFRWRWTLGLPAQPLRYLRGEIAFDETAWATLGPASFKIKAGLASLTAAGPDHAKEVAALVADGLAEPLAHELLTEADGLHKTAPRSALLLSCTALEVGTKHFIAALAPQTAWLIAELPSPPVERLLREYVPTLPRRAYMRVEAETFSQPFLNEVKKAVAVRNRITHQGKGRIDAEWLEG